MSKSTTRNKPAVVVDATPDRKPFHYEWDAQVVNVEPDMDREDPGYDDAFFAPPLRSAAELHRISLDADGNVSLDAAKVFNELVANGKAPRRGLDIPARFQDEADAAMAIFDLYGTDGNITRCEYTIERAAAEYAVRVPGIRDDIALEVVKQRYQDLATGKVKHCPPVTDWPVRFNLDASNTIHPLVYFINIPQSSVLYERGHRCAALHYISSKTYPDKITGELKMSWYDLDGFTGVIRFFDSIKAAKEAATELRQAVTSWQRISDEALKLNTQYRPDPVRGAVQEDLKPAYQQGPKVEAF